MLDEIYFRLLMELAPEPLKPRPLDAERIVNNFGMSEESRDAYGHLVGSIYENDPSSDIGLHYGRLLCPYALCDFSRALMTAPSFGNAMQIINDLHYMQGASYYLTTFESSDSISIALNYPYKKNVSEHQRRFCAEAVFIYLVNLARDSLCHSISPCKVWLDFDKPSYADAYSELFGLNIEFNAPLSILEFKNELSDVGLKTSNHTLHKTYIKKCVDSARNAERYWSFDYRTSTQLIRHLPDSFNGSTLSTILSISPRGLQKKLSLLGTSFSELSSQARIELAKVFLIQQNKSIETTSELLGFQTISGFRRFF
ncbi:hypothetical protein A3715_19515, partial [Oleiphilus sp. HI0009]